MKTLILLAFLCLWVPLWARKSHTVQLPYCRPGVEKPCKTLVYNNKEKPFMEAQLACRRNGGDLASVHSQEDNHLIHTLIMSKNNKQPRAWIGGFRMYEKNEFYWTDYSIWAYQNWRQGEPSNLLWKEHCIEMNYEDADGRWNDDRCTVEKPFVCAYNETGKKKKT